MTERDVGPRWSETGSEVDARVRDAMAALRGERPGTADVERLAAKLEARLVPRATGVPDARAPFPAADVVRSTARGTTTARVLVFGGILVATCVVWLALRLRGGETAGSPHMHETSTPGPRARAAESGEPGKRLPAPRLALATRAVQPSAAPSSHSLLDEARVATKASPAVKVTSAPHRARVYERFDDDSLAREMRLLDPAQRELALAPSRTLALSEMHRAEFPAGTLLEERETLAIEALARLGRIDEARARATRFLEIRPQSTYRNRIMRALAALR